MVAAVAKAAGAEVEQCESTSPAVETSSPSAASSVEAAVAGHGEENVLFDLELPDLLLDLSDGLCWSPIWASAAEEYDGDGLHEPLLWTDDDAAPVPPD
ncbi:unnamed protein product [Urochloa humidicola]